MKKILFISKYLSTNKNGLESRLSSIIKKFKKKNYKVAVITSSISLKNYKFSKIYTKKKINNVDFYFIKDKQKYNQYSIKRIISWIFFEYYICNFNFKKISFKPDIVYVSSLSLLSILSGIYLKKKFKAKLVFEMRDLWPFYLYSTGKFSRFNPFILFLDFVEIIGIKKSDLIVGLVPRIKEYISYRGFKNKKVLASTFPVNIKYFNEKKKKKIKLDKSKFNICYAGNFGFDNHLDELISIISKLKLTNVIFHFLGKGSQKQKLINKYCNFKNIIFHNHVNYSDLHPVLKSMDSLILSFGNKKNLFPIFGHELNKLNNYLMAEKPIIVYGDKKNIDPNRGNFLFIEDNRVNTFKIKIFNLIKNYKSFKNIAKKNKINFLIRNNEDNVFKKLESTINLL